MRYLFGSMLLFAYVSGIGVAQADPSDRSYCRTYSSQYNPQACYNDWWYWSQVHKPGHTCSNPVTYDRNVCE